MRSSAATAFMSGPTAAKPFPPSVHAEMATPPKSRYRGVELRGASSGSISNPKRTRSRFSQSTNAATDAVPGTNRAPMSVHPATSKFAAAARATNLGESCLAKTRPSVVGRSSATLESAPNARNAASPAPMSGPRSSGGPPAGLSASKTDESDKIKADRSVRAQIRRARVGRGAIRRAFASEVRGGGAGASLDVAATPARRELIAGGDTFS